MAEGLFTRRIPWTRKPPQPKIDWSNPLNKSLVAAYYPTQSGRLIDIANRHHGTASGNPVMESTPKGVGITLDGVGDSYSIPDSADLDFGASDDCTIIVFTRPDAINQDAELLEKQSGNPLYQIIAQGAGNGNTWWFQVRDTGGTLINVASTTTVAAGAFHQVVCRRAAGSTIDISINGVQEDSTGDTTGSWANATPLLIGTGNSADYTGWIGYILIFRRRLSDSEVKKIYNNPNRLLQPRSQVIPFTIPAAGGAVVGPYKLLGSGGVLGYGSNILGSGGPLG